ncbi:MAG TPA: phosphate ABC transporter permease subunit PstC [Gaiellaceae bacterium]
MATVPTSLRAGRRFGDRIGDLLLHVVTAAAAAGSVVLIGAIAYKVADGSSLSFSKFGLGFIVHEAWDPVKNHFGALSFLFGTAVTSFIALLIATPLAIGIALYLTELAPRFLRETIGALVEMLAAIPSVILGLWGLLVLGPFVQDDLEPFLHSFLGWIPLFSGEPKASGILPAALVLTIMAVPIVASVARELFQSVPAELKDGALALGATRWEMVRGVTIHYTRPGLAAAVILGLGRALGEAIAVTQVIGDQVGIPKSLFGLGDTVASRIASQYQGAASNIQISSLFYLATILLAISIIVNFGAQLVVRRFEFQHTGGT